MLEDADVELASRIAVESTFYNQGEACSSTSRILVHEAIYGDFLDRFSKTVVDLKVGDGLDAATEIGAMVDAHHYERVVQYLQIALDEGARIYAQGTVPDDPRLRGGYWVAPTILVDVAPDSTVAREEIFGPIVCVMPFHTDDEAVAIANNTQYGLYAGVCSGDEVRARSIALRLEVGAVYVNNYSRRGNAGSPSGGVKASGFGRENSPATLHEYVRSKSIRSRTGRAEIPTWPFRD